MIILGISCYYHDAAATLIKDGKVIAAAAEERFTRVKHDNSFPFNAIEFCLNSLRIAINEVDAIAFYEKPIVKFDRILHQFLHNFPRGYGVFIEKFPSWFDQKLRIRETLQDKCHYYGKIYFLEHHLAHAASTYYLSDYSTATIVTLDGVGEWATTTVGYGKGKKITIDNQINFPHSLGLLYSTFTSYLGFSVNDAEYKVMGLAAYGNPDRYEDHFKKLIKMHGDGSYQLNMDYFDFTHSEKMFNQRLCDLFGLPPRQPESESKKDYQDIAAALQLTLERVVFNLLNTAYKNYQNPNLCLAGGVALNSVMNGKILSNTPFKKIFIPPDPGDAGCSMGAALYLYYQLSPRTMRNPQSMTTPYLGPSYSWLEIEKALQKHGLAFTFYKNKKKLVADVANFLVKQQIIGWFQGRMEWGPRALGNRSILASAATEAMRDIINKKVKHRELFRPFAPVIIESFVKKYFVSDVYLSPSVKWMLMVYPFKKRGQTEVPAVYHVDGTGRLQTVARGDNLLYYDLIKQYYKKTGTPIIINTSFNVRGEPIVCSPEDAINCFLKTDIDHLVLGDYLVSKKKLRKKKYVERIA